MPQKRTRKLAIALPLLLFVATQEGSLFGDEKPSPAAPLMRLIKSPRVPQAQLARLIELICQRGNSDDLTYLFEQAVKKDVYPAQLRRKTLSWLADAARTRKVRPGGQLEQLKELILPVQGSGDRELRLAAIQLAGVCRAASLSETMRDVALDPKTPMTLRQAALEALTSIDPNIARGTIEKLISIQSDRIAQQMAVAALAQIDTVAAATAAVELLSDFDETDDPAVLLNAFLNRKNGSKELAGKLTGKSLKTDTAKLALRHMYSIGRSDPELASALSTAAGLEANPKPLSAAEVKKLATEVLQKGDPARGESVFRRADVSCMRCHAVSKAGGQVGPDLSAVGASSPVDYLINSILQPNQAVKEAYLTHVIYTLAGKVHQGILVNRDTQRLILKDAAGNQITIPTADIDEETEGTSLMPQGLTKFLTRAELIDLVRFLSELGKPGPFAIRKKPTFQRWRVLRELPGQPGAADVDFDVIREELPALPQQAWVPLYAKVAGGVPLAEVARSTKSPLLLLRAEFDVTADGKVGIEIDAPVAWEAAVDDGRLQRERRFEVDAAKGRHRLNVLIRRSNGLRGDLRAELFPVEGSEAEFQVVDGQ